MRSKAKSSAKASQSAPQPRPDPLADPRDPTTETPGERAVAREDARLRRKGKREASEPMPLHIYGESEGDHARRHARTWRDAPANLPKGEEGGTAYQPDTSWVKEK